MVLTLREYLFPLLLAIVLHALTFYALHSGWNPSHAVSRVIKPQIVRSKLIMLEPKVEFRPAPKQPPPAVVERAVPKPESEPVEVKPEPKPDLQAERVREREVERRRQQEAERRLETLAQSSFLDALEAEATDLAENNAASEAELVAQSYRYGIYQRLVANWSRPPSARNGMQAKLQVDLVPTGDVVAVIVLESSGNDAFDRSAQAAVRKSRRFEVPMKAAIFEKYFRRFTLLFRPEDLLR